MTMTVDPSAEWHQMFNDAWRIERDYFYDPGMHGVDWNEMRTRYGKLIDDAVSRWDVTFVLGELIGELNSSHTYVQGGQFESGPRRNIGLLGADFALENGAYCITQDRRRRRVGQRSALAAQAAGHQGERGRLPARRERRAARRRRRTSARRSRGSPNAVVSITVNDKPTIDRRAHGARQAARRRVAAPQPGVDRVEPKARRRGDARPRRLRLRAEHRRRRADGAGAAVPRAGRQGRHDHRRAVQQRRPDPRPVHRTARPPDQELLEDARRQYCAADAAGRAARARR